MGKITVFDAKTGLSYVKEVDDSEIEVPEEVPSPPTLEEQIKALQEAMLILMGGM